MAMTLCCLQTKCIVGPYTRFLSHVMCQKYERHNGRIQGQSCRDASLSLVYFLGHGGVRSPPRPPFLGALDARRRKLFSSHYYKRLK